MLISNSVFTIRVTGVNSGTGKTTEGVLHFVDLVASDAASEAAKKDSGFEDSDKKGPEIDRSLKGIEDVILALSSNKDSQAPYLSSKVKEEDPACVLYISVHTNLSLIPPSTIGKKNIFIVADCLYLSRL